MRRVPTVLAALSIAALAVGGPVAPAGAADPQVAAAGVLTKAPAPALGSAAVRPQPVPPRIVTLAIPAVGAVSGSGRTPGSGTPATSAPADHAAGPHVVAATTRTGVAFDVAGVTFAGPAPDGMEVLARTHTALGWSGWVDLHVTDHGPDAGTAEAARAQPATEPVTAAGSDAIEVQVLTGGAAPPKDLAVVLVSAGSSPADAEVGSLATTVEAAVTPIAPPAVVSRAAWGADESLVNCTPDTLAAFRGAVVHHTVNANNYTSEQAPGLVRGILAFHTQSRDYCDIGYNFLVDRFGRVYEGRRGSISGFVQGAQTGGFNEHTFGTSVIGDYTSISFGSAVVGSLTRVIAWQADRSGFDPAGMVTMTTTGNTKFDPGEQTTQPRVMGHRDLSLTSCPGEAAYPQVPGIRSSAAALWRAAQFTAAPSVFTPVGPTRVLDTRSGLGAPQAPIGARTGLALRIPGLPTDATAVTLNLTAVGAYAPTYLSVYPGGVPRRGTSVLNVGRDRAVAGLVTVGVGPGGVVNVYNGPAATHLTADLAGWYRPSSGAGFTPLPSPARVLDTRLGLGGPTGLVRPGSTLTLRVPGLPAGATAVTVNLTGVGAGDPTYVTAFAAGRTRPATSSLNVSDGNAIANLVTVPVGAGGTISLYNGTAPLHLLVDLAGYYAPGVGLRYVPVTPRRVLDTRLGFGAPRDKVASARAFTLVVEGLPSSLAGAALTVTATRSDHIGYVAAYPGGLSPPPVSTLNTVPGLSVANLATVATGIWGTVNFYNRGGETDLIADLNGYFVR